MPDDARIYERLEQLERSRERHEALIGEIQRRMDSLESMREDIRHMERAIARLEERIESIISRLSVWWALMWLILGGVVAAGFELFKR